MPAKFTPASVGTGPRPGHRKVGPDRFGCSETGTRPTLYRLANSLYGELPEWIVCEAEIDLPDAVHALAMRLTAGVHWVGPRRSWAFRGRLVAVEKFIMLCNARADGNRADRIRRNRDDLLAHRNARRSA